MTDALSRWAQLSALLNDNGAVECPPSDPDQTNNLGITSQRFDINSITHLITNTSDFAEADALLPPSAFGKGKAKQQDEPPTQDWCKVVSVRVQALNDPVGLGGVVWAVCEWRSRADPPAFATASQVIHLTKLTAPGIANSHYGLPGLSTFRICKSKPCLPRADSFATHVTDLDHVPNFSPAFYSPVKHKIFSGMCFCSSDVSAV